MDSARADLSGVGWTSLVTLHLRALDARSPRPVLGDVRAVAALERLRDGGADVGSPWLRATRGDRFLVAARAALIDRWVREALHPSVTVLHLGCGLDSRAWRVGGGSRTGGGSRWGRWIDVDRPDVAAVRAQLYPDAPPRYDLLATSVTAPDWLTEVSGNGLSGDDVLVVAEGLSMYLTADEVATLLGRLTSRFAHGRLVLDVAAPWVVATSWWMPSTYRAFRMGWAPRGPADVRALAPDLRFVEGIDVLDPALRQGVSLPRAYRAALDALRWLEPNTLTVTRWEF